MKLSKQKGFIKTTPILIIIAFIGILSFVLISRVGPFRSGLQNNLYPKKLTFAKSDTNAAFVPDEIIVKYKEGDNPNDIQKEVTRRANLKNQPLGTAQIALEDAAGKAKGEDTPEEKLRNMQNIDTQSGMVSKDELVNKNLSPQAAATDLRNFYILKLKPNQDIHKTITVYQNSQLIESAEPNYIGKANFIPNDPYFPQMWNLTKMSMPATWDSTTGNNLIVGVVDSGVDYNHPDIPLVRIIKGHDYVNNDEDPMDDDFHGTFLTGEISAITNNGIGVSGMNWQSRMLEVKVLDSTGVGSFSNIANGIIYAADNGAKVINVSIDANGVSCLNALVMKNAVSYAVGKNIPVIVAAGNEGVDASNDAPASCPGAIVVAATGPSDERATYSNYGPLITVAAPGGLENCSDSSCMITSTGLSGQYLIGAGTSFSTAEVTAATSLMLAANPNLVPTQIASILQSSGDAITTDQLISGHRLNVLKAVQMAKIAPSPTPTPASTPTPTTSPNFGLIINPTPTIINTVISQGGTNQVLTLSSPTGGNFAMFGYPTSYGPGINWSTSSGGLQPNLPTGISIEAISTVPVGTYSGTGVVEDNSNNKAYFPVTVQVVAPTPTPAPTNSPNFSLTVNPTPTIINAVVPQGGQTQVMTLSSPTLNGFTVFGNPTSMPGINWLPSSGGLLPNTPQAISIQVNQNVPAGIYSGTGVLGDNSNAKINFPVTVHVVATSTPTPTLAPTPSSGTCPKATLGDTDCDGIIGIFDFNTLITNFNKTGVGVSGGDLDSNGKVDIFDFNTLVTNFGK